MTIKMLCLEEGANHWISKNGPRRDYQASMRDHSDGQRCMNNFIYNLTPEEEQKFGGKMKDREFSVHVKEIMQRANGNLTISGSIEAASVNGK